MMQYFTTTVQQRLDHDESVNIIIDECCYSRLGMIQLYREAGSPFEIVVFPNTEDFLIWRECNSNRINSLTIYFHDRMNLVPENMARFLIKDVGGCNLSKNDIFVISDTPDNLTQTFINKLHLFNLINGRDKLSALLHHFKEYVSMGAKSTLYIKGYTIKNTDRSHKDKQPLSPAEIFALTSLLSGQGIKETSKHYRGNYKTLYNQRSSALKKLGMCSIKDVIRYRHFIIDLYLNENSIVYSNYDEALC